MRAINENIISGKKHEIETLKYKILDWLLYTIFISVLIFIFYFVIGITLVTGSSMNPTLKNEPPILVSKMFFEPNRGDIVIIKEAEGFNIIKRIIGLPNDKVKITNGIVYINGKPLNETYTEGTSNDMEEITIPKGEYFILGDNRTPGESLDSRSSEIGSITEEIIVGEVILSIYPFKNL